MTFWVEFHHLPLEIRPYCFVCSNTVDILPCPKSPLSPPRGRLVYFGISAAFPSRPRDSEIASFRKILIGCIARPVGRWVGRWVGRFDLEFTLACSSAQTALSHSRLLRTFNIIRLGILVLRLGDLTAQMILQKNIGCRWYSSVYSTCCVHCKSLTLTTRIPSLFSIEAGRYQLQK